MGKSPTLPLILRKTPMELRVKWALEAMFVYLAQQQKAMESKEFLTILSEVLAYWQIPQEYAEKFMKPTKQPHRKDFDPLTTYGELLLPRIKFESEIESLAVSKAAPLMSQEERLFRIYTYVVYEGQKSHTFSEENKLGNFRAKKKTYDIYVDDLTSEILVKGKKPSLLAGETTGFLLLKCLLRRVGDHWTHADLFKELGLIYTKEDRVNVMTNVRPLLHRYLELIRESFRPLAGKAKVDRYFNSSNPKRIAVWKDLNSCLIESLS